MGEAGGIGAQVGEVARRETRRDGRIGEPRDERLARRGLDVDESDRGALPCEALDDPFAYPGAAAADDDALARKAGVAGAGRRRLDPQPTPAAQPPCQTALHWVYY